MMRALAHSGGCHFKLLQVASAKLLSSPFYLCRLVLLGNSPMNPPKASQMADVFTPFFQRWLKPDLREGRICHLGTSFGSETWEVTFLKQRTPSGPRCGAHSPLRARENWGHALIGILVPISDEVSAPHRLCWECPTKQKHGSLTNWQQPLSKSHICIY